MATAAAVVGGAIISGQSSKSAASKGAQAQKDAAGSITAAGNRARQDVLREIPEAQRQLLLGARGAFDIFQRAIPLQQQQLSQGNLAAQRTTGQGFEQAQQALLGGAVSPFSESSVDFAQQPFAQQPSAQQPFAQGDEFLKLLQPPPGGGQTLRELEQAEIDRLIAQRPDLSVGIRPSPTSFSGTPGLVGGSGISGGFGVVLPVPDEAFGPVPTLPPEPSSSPPPPSGGQLGSRPASRGQFSRFSGSRLGRF